MSKQQAGMGLEAAGMVVAIVGNVYGGEAGYAIMALGAGLSVAGGKISAGASKIKPKQAGQLMNFRSSRQPLPLLYGELETGCNKTFYHVANPYLHIVCELGEGPIEGIKRQDGTIWTTTGTQLPLSNPPLVYLDRKLWTQWISYGRRANGSTDHGDPRYPYIEFFNGSASQGVCTTLQTASGGKWDQALRNTAYLYMRLEFDIDCYKQEPDITALMRGLRIYNPVTSTTAWTNSPALHAYDYMTRSSQRGGIGIAPSRNDLTALDAAIDYCTAKGWTCNLPIDEQQAVADNLAQILACFRGEVIYSENLFKIRYRDLNYEPIVMDLTEADIVAEGGRSSLRIRQPDITHRPNTVRATWSAALRNSKPDDYVFPDAAAVAADGDVREKAVALYGFDNLALVQKMCNYFLERERLNRESGCTARDRASGLEPLDLIRLTHSMPGWNQQVLRVMGVGLSGNHTVSLALIEEDDTFYDDTYNLTSQDYHDTTLIDPSADPPDVINATITEESYDFRLRSATRLNVSFDRPVNYPWFDYVQVWISTDGGANYLHQFNAKTSFSIDPAEEGAFYFVRLRVVNVFGRCQDESTAVTLSRNVVGRSVTVPQSLDAIMAIVTSGALNVFGERVIDPDIELYEFRLGASWSGAVFLASQRAPVLSLSGVRPGSHTIWANTFATNKLYGANPRSAGVVVKSPPDGWTLMAGYGPDANLIVNGDMELDSNWASVGTPLGNSRSSAQKKSGSYSRNFSVDATGEGIRSDVFTVVNGAYYSWSLWVYPTSGATHLHVQVNNGSGGSGVYAHEFDLVQNQWNFISGSYQENAGGASAQMYLRSMSQSSGNWYIDDVCLMQGEVSGACAYLYNGDPHIRLTHAAGLTGTWKSQIWDLGASGRYLAYALADVAVIAGSQTWATLFPTGTETWAQAIGGKSWADVFAPSAAPQIKVKLLYGDASPPASEIERLEILCAIATGRYFQLEVSIIDPNAETYGLFESPMLKLCQ